MRPLNSLANRFELVTMICDAAPALSLTSSLERRLHCHTCGSTTIRKSLQRRAVLQYTSLVSLHW